MRLRQRLEALEKRLITEPTRLTMPGGDVVAIRGSGKHLLTLLGVAVRCENGVEGAGSDPPMRGGHRAGRRAHSRVDPVLLARTQGSCRVDHVAKHGGF